MKKLMIVLLFVCLTACSSETTTTTPPAEPAAEPVTPPPAAEPAPEATPAPPPPAPEPPKAAEPAKAADKPAVKPAAKAIDKPAPGTKVYAKFETSMGNFKAELNEKEAPITVANFVGLASGTKEWTDPRTGQMVKKPYYDGLTFHRVIGPVKSPPDGFMIQGGDPLGNGQGGPGFTIKDERNNLKHDKPGVLAMARTQLPDSAGSQFYITVGSPMFLDGQNPPYVVFGQVIEGLETIQTIGRTPTDPGDRPLTPVIIKKITIERAK